MITIAIGTDPKGLDKSPESLEIKGRIETVQTTAFLRSSRILRKLDIIGV